MAGLLAPGGGEAAVAQHVLASGAFAPGWDEYGIRASGTHLRQMFPSSVGGADRSLILAVSGYGQGVAPEVIAQRFDFYGAASQVFRPRIVELAAGRVQLEWTAPGDLSSPVRLERKINGTDWREIANRIFAREGAITWTDPTILPGVDYEYRLGVPEGTGEGMYGAIRVHSPFSLFLRTSGPNPSRGDLTVTFSLPASSRARIQIFDAGGRLVRARDVTAYGPGTHEITLLGEPPLRSGAYFLRLIQGASKAVTRFTLVR